MSKGRTYALLGGVAVAVGASMMSPPATGVNISGPDNETVWEQGTVSSVSDGDTLVANLTAGSGARGSKRVRTIGVQAPEVAHDGTLADCGGAQATDKLKSQLPVGAPVQTRSVQVSSYDDYSGGRIVRSLYAQDEEGNWYDTSRSTMSQGWVMWFPLSASSTKKPEWAHNLEYRVLADDAAGQGRGLWSANLCGASPYLGTPLRVWAKYWASGSKGTPGYNPERVYIQNLGTNAIDVSGWTIRDSAISAYHTLPPGTVVQGGTVREVYADFTGAAPMNLNNLPANNTAFEGDALYVMDNAGPYGTGNLRAWFPYPCNPDACTDPLKGPVTISKLQRTEPATRAPSAPGSVSAVASTDGSGNVNVTWAAPNDPGAASLSYKVRAYEHFDDLHPDINSLPATPVAEVSSGTTSALFPSLTLGKAYTFLVVATNSAGETRASELAEPVTPISPVAPPVIDSLSSVAVSRTGAVVSWARPANGRPISKYTITATPGGVGPWDVTVADADSGPGAVTSKVLTGLAEDITYRFTVTATDSTGAVTTTSASSAPVEVALASPVGSSGTPNAPSDVVVATGPDKVNVSWHQDTATNKLPTGYKIVYAPAAGGTPQEFACPDQATSCTVAGLAVGTKYNISVKAAINAATATSASVQATTGYYTDSQSGSPSSPPEAADPWTSGQFVEITNAPGSATAYLGGYGFWNSASSNYLNDGSLEDRASYLLPPELQLPAGGKVRVHFGATPAAPSANTTVIEATAPLFDPSNDFLQLANLNRAQLDCQQWGTGQCKTSAQLSLASSPVGITARTTPNTVTVSWGAPISRGGQAITGYTATAYNAPVGGAPIGSCSADGASYTCSFGGSIGTKYYVEVVATNPSGNSAPSWRVLASPKTIPASPTSVAVTPGKGSLTATWAAGADNGAAITKFTARAYRAGTGGSASASCTATTGSCTIAGLAKGTTYYVDVTATNRVGEGPASTPRVGGTTTGSTTAVSTYSKKKVTVRWVPVPGVTSYQAKVFDAAAGGKLLGACTGKATASKCTTKKLKKKKLYYIDLTMISAAGPTTLTPRIVTGPAKKASPPVAITASAVGTKVTIGWDDPLFTGYSILKTYSGRVYSKAKGGSVKAKCTAAASRYTCTTKATSKLKKGKTYYVAAAVKNGKGWSKYATPRVAITIQ